MNISSGCSCSSCDQYIENPTFHSFKKLCNMSVCLDRLTTLDISSSGICEAPAFIGNIINIVKLDLSSNELETLPLSFANCHHLTDLILSHNKFSQVPQCIINGMRSIQTLDLSHNQLLDISIKPFCVQQLLTLNISNNSKLNSLPQWLWSIECNSLESLDISFTNCLDNIVEDPYLNMYGIGNHLKSLYLSNTSADLQKLGFVKSLKNLRKLILDNTDTMVRKNHNYFCDIPLVFNYRFKFIDSLSMINVDLSSIGQLVYFCLPNLRFLNLSNNSIVLLPDSLSELTNLEVCDFSNNQILAIPKSFKSLKNLKSLILNNNWLSTFPNIIEDLLSLEILDLYANKLTLCPSWKINKNIKLLDLEQNIFSTQNTIEENYSELLENLRSSITESRVIGPLCLEEPYDIDFETCESSDSDWSLNSFSELSIHEENQDDTYFKPEELWECNTYELTTNLFNPKNFELDLINELKTLEDTSHLKGKKKILNVARFVDQHYFCPSDELPETLPIK